MDHTVFGFTKERLLLPKFATHGSRYFFLRLFFDAVPTPRQFHVKVFVTVIWNWISQLVNRIFLRLF